MWCEQREHLLSEYRRVMAKLTALAGMPTEVDETLAAIARLDLREHVEEHGCWSHATYSSLFFLWRDQWADATEESSQAAS